MKVRRLLALTLGVLMFAGTTAIASASPSEEAEFVALINQSRGAAGLGSLSVHNDLVVGARKHTAEMIAAGTIFHSTSAQLSSVTSGWSVLGENVGKGPNPSVLHRAFMESPSHKANVLGDYDRVGVGVGHDADGKVYVTAIFMKSANTPATTTTTSAPPATTTTTTSPATTTTTIAAASASEPEAEAEAEPAPFRPSAPVVERESSRTLGLELVDDERWVEGTYCLVVRSYSSICLD